MAIFNMKNFLFNFYIKNYNKIDITFNILTIKNSIPRLLKIQWIHINYSNIAA